MSLILCVIDGMTDPKFDVRNFPHTKSDAASWLHNIPEYHFLHIEFHMQFDFASSISIYALTFRLYIYPYMGTHDTLHLCYNMLFRLVCGHNTCTELCVRLDNSKNRLFRCIDSQMAESDFHRY